DPLEQARSSWSRSRADARHPGRRFARADPANAVARGPRAQARLRDRRPRLLRHAADHAALQGLRAQPPGRAGQRHPGQARAVRRRIRHPRRQPLRLRRLRPHPRQPGGRHRLRDPAQQPAPRIQRPREQGGQARPVRKADGGLVRRMPRDDRRRQSGEPQADDRLPQPVRAAQPARDRAGAERTCRPHPHAPLRARLFRAARHLAARPGAGGRRINDGHRHLQPQRRALPDGRRTGVGQRGRVDGPQRSALRGGRGPHRLHAALPVGRDRRMFQQLQQQPQRLPRHGRRGLHRCRAGDRLWRPVDARPPRGRCPGAAAWRSAGPVRGAARPSVRMRDERRGAYRARRGGVARRGADRGDLPLRARGPRDRDAAGM
ncbi:MAG: Glucose-fructose oxidoreductase, partial [uncultured Sphingomonadaceae bacterium]